MRRAERLFRTVQILRRDSRVVTAEEIAGELEVSKRTVYRDIAHLIGSGLPIDGEAGVGYLLGPGVDLPPLTFTYEQIDALVLGIHAVTMLADADLAAAGQEALSKIEGVLPPDHAARLRQARVIALRGEDRPPPPRLMPRLRKAIDAQAKLEIDYVSLQDARSRRVVRPLALTTFGVNWLLVAWCEARNDFRTFRVDRIEQVQALGATFEHEPGKTLDDYLSDRARHVW